jgi:hypothetical protein
MIEIFIGWILLIIGMTAFTISLRYSKIPMMMSKEKGFFSKCISFYINNLGTCALAMFMLFQGKSVYNQNETLPIMICSLIIVSFFITRLKLFEKIHKKNPVVIEYVGNGGLILVFLSTAYLAETANKLASL